MSTDQECDTNKVDIVSGVLMDTEYPVEKFTLKWRISNYSKIFNKIEAEFSTTSKSTLWRLRFDRNSVELWKYFDNPRVHVRYEVAIKTCHQILRNDGSKIFERTFDHCTVIQIPSVECDPNDVKNTHKVKFENDVINIELTLIILGHTITRKTPLLSVQEFTSKQINYDMENLFNSKEHSDIIIRVSGGENNIPAHKAILCARSPVFNVMFQQDMLETTNNEIEIDDIDIDTLHDFVLFLYSGKCRELSWDTAMKLYYTADKYEVKDLRDICSRYFQTNLTTENACFVLKLADQHKDDNLKESVVHFIKMHASCVKMTQCWKDLIRDHPKLITEIFQ